MFNKTFEKKRLMVACKQINKKIFDPCNAKEHYQSFIENRITNSVTQSKIITSKPETFENRNIVDIISVITEYPNTSHKVSKTIRTNVPNRL